MLKPPTPHPPLSTGFLAALTFLWVLVLPGLLVAPIANPGAGPVTILISGAFAAGLVAGTTYALFRLMRVFLDRVPDDPRTRPVLHHTLDRMKATWTLDTLRPGTLIALMFGLGLHGWMLLGTYWSTQMDDPHLRLSLLFTAILIAGSLPWLRQLARELRRPRHFTLHATVDHLRVESPEGTTELAMHELVASAPGDTLQLVSGDTEWSGPCPNSNAQRLLLESLQAMAGRTRPAETPEEPEALRRLRVQQAT